jgi:hypothetical protein
VAEYAVTPKGSILRLISFLALAAGLLVLLPAAAPAASGGATVFTHSARSGELRGGLLTLRGVGSHLTWAHNHGRSGTISVERLHRRLFAPETPPVGTLHVAGQRPRRARTFRLSRPRYNAARDWVRYRVKRLSKRRQSGGLPRASQTSGTSQFKAASLSIVGHPSRLGASSSGGNYCAVGLLNLTIYDLQAASKSKWDTDDWDPGIPDIVDNLGGTASWASQGGFLRGCSNTAVWVAGSDPPASFTITTTYPWPGNPIETCKPSDRTFTCSRAFGLDEVNWVIRPTL